MDAFYASVEVREQPHLAGKPVIVGGLSPRSVVLSATYEARRFGVHSAMPMGQARRLCPTAIVVPPQRELYAEASQAAMDVFESVTPIVEPLSLDEAFLDVSGAQRLLGSPRQIAQTIRARIVEQLSITCSVGVATTKFVAKLASSHAKPDGLIVVPRDGVLAFLHPLPIGALWGVGERAEEALRRLGLQTIGDIADVGEAALVAAVGKAAGVQLFALACGHDDRRVHREPERSVGAEETFERDLDDPAAIRREILRLAERTAGRLRASAHVGRTVVLKIRFADFTTITRSRTLGEATDVARIVYETAVSLYDGLDIARARVRLVGVRVEGLATADEAARQLAIDGSDELWRAAERAADQAADRFGAGAVRPATLVGARPPTPASASTAPTRSPSTSAAASGTISPGPSPGTTGADSRRSAPDPPSRQDPSVP